MSTGDKNESVQPGTSGTKMVKKEVDAITVKNIPFGLITWSHGSVY